VKRPAIEDRSSVCIGEALDQAMDLTARYLSDRAGLSPDNMQHLYNVMQELVTATHATSQDTQQLQADVEELRGHIADFDDFWRPIRNYFYWEPHCFDIPICWSLRSVFDTIDGLDSLTDDTGKLTGSKRKSTPD
jgi:putative drug exporter of the RND superfamily